MPARGIEIAGASDESGSLRQLETSGPSLMAARLSLTAAFAWSCCLVVSASARQTDEREVYRQSASTEAAAVLPDSVKQPQLKITVEEVQSSLQIGMDRNTRTWRLALRLTVENTSSVPQPVARELVALRVNDQPAEAGLLETTPALPHVQLMPGQTVEGWVWFSQIPHSPGEPQCELLWRRPPRSGDEVDSPVVEAATDSPTTIAAQAQVRISLNDVFQRLNSATTQTHGPEPGLLVLTVRRSLDVIAVWSLAPVLRKASADGFERLLFVAPTDRPPELSPIVVTDEFLSWLSTLADVEAGAEPAAGLFAAESCRFKHIAVAGLAQSANRRFNTGPGPVRLHESPDDAIRAALLPVYRHAAIDLAIRDFDSDHAGVRLAALAGALDRLTAEQSAAVLQRIRTAEPSRQAEAAGLLHLLPGPQSIHTLQELIEGGHPEVAAAALMSLAASRSTAAEPAMAAVWRSQAGSLPDRAAIADVLMKTQDDRWGPLLAEHLHDLLIAALPADDEPDTPPALTAQTLASVQGLLERLRERNSAELATLVRLHVTRVTESSLQDALLLHLLRTDPDGSADEIRQCVTARLATRTATPAVFEAAVLFRSPDWTPALLELSNGSDTTRDGLLPLRAALSCASPAQLAGILDRFSGYGPEAQQMVLVAAAGTALPGWRELAIELIDRPGAMSGDAIQLLGQDASEESLLALRQRLERYATELEGTVDASVEGQRFFQALIVQVSLFAHPECRRLLNRLARSENEYLSGTAERRILDAGRRSPAFRALEDAHRFRMSGQSDQELQLLDLAVQLDPLLPEAYTRRASARMHAGRFDDALLDLEVASELSPEELEVLSLTALVRIRQGQLDEGLRAAEAAIELAPRNWVALYNGACVCARAAELPDLPPDRRLSLADRAIQLLRETGEQGFSDVEHLQKDRDLLPLHSHVMWPEVVQRVTANKSPKIEKPDE